MEIKAFHFRTLIVQGIINFSRKIFYKELSRVSNDGTEVFNLDREYLHAFGEVSPKKRDVEWKR